MREPTVSEACALTAGAAMWQSMALPEAGIPGFTMADGPMGVASGNIDERDISLLTPCPTALGASWDRAMVAQVAALVGGDAVERGVDALLAPNLNLARSPLAGRAFEYFSEDPLLAGRLGAAWIAGLQSTGTGAVAKHLVCNDSETDRDRVDVQVDERTLREVYLLPFELAAEAGCVAMLAAYNKVNGAWCSEQAHVMTDIVKGEWGFPGLIMSDWFGTHSTDHTIAAGLDLEMPGPARFMGPKVEEAVRDGRVAYDRVIDAARRVSQTALRVSGPKSAPMPAGAAAALLEEAAADGFVLLRNEGGMLPLVPGSARRIVVIGPNAAAPCYQGGTFAKIAVAPQTPAPIDAIRARYDRDCEILFETGVDPQPRLPSMPVTPLRDLGDGSVKGMTIDYFATPDCSGPPLASETRSTNSLVWFAGQHRQSRFDQPGSVRASGRYLPQESGLHRFYLGATGPVRMSVGDREILRADRDIPAKDVMGVLKSGDADMVDVELQAGVEVLVTVEFLHPGARVHGLWYGIRPPDSPEARLARAVEAAKSADAVFLIVGETSDSSVESKDRADTRLPAEQISLIEAVAAANPRTAIIANVGHAFDAEWSARAAALLVAWYPGQGFAPALASVLAGDREPGGRMPVSIAVREANYPGYSLEPDAAGQLPYWEGVRLGYRGLIANGAPARYALGSGFGYAQFEWRDAAIADGAVVLTVVNQSARPGADVIQVYRDLPECALVGFEKVRLQPGEARRVSIPLESRMFRSWADGWQRMRGDIQLRVARSAEAEGIALTLSLPA